MLIGWPYNVSHADPTGTSICDLPEYRGTAEYNKYCSSSGGSGRSAAPSGAGPTPQQQLIQQGVAIGAYAIGQELHKAIFGSPEEDARRRAESAVRAAEQKRREEEAARRAEETKQRLLGESKSSDPDSLSLMGVEPVSDLQLMTGDESASASAGSGPSKNAPGAASIKHSEAFNKGFEDASQCYSQNAGPRCVGAAADQQQACLSDYRSGYQVGDKQRQQALDEADRVGQMAGSSGRPADAASDPRALGPCRTQWIEAYNRGYFKGKNASVRH
ncbi:MAG: hypothetical protein HY274_01940 [Gammaproteobacteria bacterium]|nr:hypothetical protein [Gammaproteobacteria bacterium]